MTDPSAPRPDDAATAAVLAALVAVARRVEAAGVVAPVDDDALLTSVVAATAAALDAQAASIALHDPATDRLVFVAAAGPAAGEVVGLAIESGAGIAGYAFTTGQPLAIADVATDARFDRRVAEATGYVPRSLLATPLIDGQGTVGVLEALDRRGDSGVFTLHDLGLAAALAAVATAAVRASRVGQDTRRLLRDALVAVARSGGSDAGATSPDPATTDALVSRLADDLAAEHDDPTWRLADRIARLRTVDPEDVELAIDWLDALLRRPRR